MTTRAFCYNDGANERIIILDVEKKKHIKAEAPTANDTWIETKQKIALVEKIIKRKRMITMFVTEQDLKDVFGKDFEIEITPEIAAQFMTSEFSTEAILRMKEQDLTLKDLAEKIGIKPGTLSEKLNGSNMTFKSAAQIALALGCDIEARN